MNDVLHRGRAGSGHRPAAHGDRHGVPRPAAACRPLSPPNAPSDERAPNTEEKTEPITATPRVGAELAGGVVDRRPDAGAGRGRTSMIDSVAGVEISPMPSPMSTICGTIVALYDVSTSRSTDPGHRRAEEGQARRHHARVPTRGASCRRRPTRCDRDRDRRIRAPVESGPKPRTTWKYCVIRKMKPDSAKNVTVTAPLAALNRRSANRLTSSIGCFGARARP